MCFIVQIFDANGVALFVVHPVYDTVGGGILTFVPFIEGGEGGSELQAHPHVSVEPPTTLYTAF